MNYSLLDTFHRQWFSIAIISALGVCTSTLADQNSASANSSRASAGLQLLYDFQSDRADLVADRSASKTPINLKFKESKEIARKDGTLQFQGKGNLLSGNEASRLNQEIKRSGELSIELWLTPADLGITGPARILTISKNTVERNITIGQEKDHFDVRLRTTKTSTNGLPSLASSAKTVHKKLTHFLYTRDRRGQAKIYLDGKLNAESKIEGSLANWDPTFQFALGNEATGDRPWKGSLHLVAVYNRALTASEAVLNFKAGPDAKTSVEPPVTARSKKEKFFETEVAAVFVRHCFECHDSSTKEGGLDLSRKAAAIKGGDSGKLFTAGKHSESLLWELINSNDMPKKRSPLSETEKQIVKRWIDEGAVWSLDQIDAAVYAHDANIAGNWIRRLTIPEYIETVRATVGVDISKEARELLPPDLRADGFSNTAYNLSVDLKHVNAYSQLAEIIVSRLDAAKFASEFSKKKRLIDDDMRALAEKMGRWILRGPLTEREIVIYRGISTTVASAGGDYEEVVKYTIQAMLQSPRFLYRIESQRGDGSSLPVNSYELASRLSYIIWGSSPDKELMRAADYDELFDPQILSKQIKRMLADPRAIEQSVRFIDEWLNLKRLENLRPDSKRFPNWNVEIARDMQQESREYFKEIVWKQQRPLADLLNAQTTFLTPQLAKHYGLDLKVDGLSQVSLQKIPSRGGILTQGSVLTVGGDEASMVSRGLFVLHDLLRGVVNDPPPCVDTTPVPTKPGLTQRAIAMERLANGTCGGCHSKFEPLAFGLEKFDGLGTFHETDKHGNPLREDGEILIPGDEKPIKYQTSSELMDLLADSERVSECLTWKVTQFSLGRPLVAEDVSMVREIHLNAKKNGGSWSSLIEAIIHSELVQMTRTEPSK